MEAKEMKQIADDWNYDREFHEVMTLIKESANKGEYYVFITIKKESIDIIHRLENRGYKLGEKIDFVNFWSLPVMWGDIKQ